MVDLRREMAETDRGEPVIDEQALCAYLAEVSDEITRGLGTEELQITLEPVASASTFTHDKLAIDWVTYMEQLVPRSGPAREGYMRIEPFGLTRDELHLIDAGLKDVVGEDYRAYLQTSGRRPAIWRAFILEGSRGRYRLELWLCD